jgi:hypothetical protein
MQPHAIEILVRWSNDYMDLKEYNSGAWHDWYKLGGQVAPGTAPGASGLPGRGSWTRALVGLRVKRTKR